MATLKEIASLAGVSTTCVSIVLNRKPEMQKIPEATRQRIQKIALDLNYKPNVSARALQRGNSENTIFIGVLQAYDNFMLSVLMTRVWYGMTRAVLKSGKNIQIINYPFHAGKLYKQRDMLMATQCHGIIASNASENDLEYLEKELFNVPVLMYLQNNKRYSSIGIDDIKVGKLAARALHSNGCKRPMCLINDDVFTVDIRERSFIEEAEILGMTPLERDKAVTIDLKEAYQIITSFDQDSMPDSFFCANDYIAYSVISAIRDRGLRVPEDIKIVSVGNGIVDLEKTFTPKLSTVSMPLEEMGEACLNAILEMIENPEYQPFRREMPVVYEPRETCGPI